MFKKGQKVICVKGTRSRNVIKGRIYTIKYWSFGGGVLLYETEPDLPFEFFKQERFRPLDDSWIDDLFDDLKYEVEKEEIEKVNA